MGSLTLTPEFIPGITPSAPLLQLVLCCQRHFCRTRPGVLQPRAAATGHGWVPNRRSRTLFGRDEGRRCGHGRAGHERVEESGGSERDRRDIVAERHQYPLPAAEPERRVQRQQYRQVTERDGNTSATISLFRR
jgi:hypothetical protein